MNAHSSEWTKHFVEVNENYEYCTHPLRLYQFEISSFRNLGFWNQAASHVQVVQYSFSAHCSHNFYVDGDTVLLQHMKWL
jgi:hypothetical protein